MRITRDQLENMVADTFRRFGAVGVFFATGTGKTKAALKAVEPEGPDSRGLIVCHTEISRDTTWPDEMRKWDIQLNNVHLLCYASLQKHAAFADGYDWAILDEAQYLTDLNYFSGLKRITIDKIIVLTATQPEDQGKMAIINQLCKGHTLEVGLDTAIDNKILNDYRIRVWEVALTPLEWQEYLRLSKAIQNAKMRGIDFLVKKAAGERARFIYNCESKYKAAAWLRDQIRASGKRFIMHCGSIQMAERLTPYTIHSKSDSDKHFQAFCRGDIDECASVRMLKESANIDRLESSLVQQVNSKQLGLIQEVGRNMRLPPDQTAIIHILIAKNTVDKDWLTKSIRSFRKDKITYHEIDREKIDHYQ